LNQSMRGGRRTGDLTLEDLLNDPIIRIIMARDGVVPDRVRQLVADVVSRRPVLERCVAA